MKKNRLLVVDEKEDRVKGKTRSYRALFILVILLVSFKFVHAQNSSFPVVAYVGVPANQATLARYQEFAEAGFNLDVNNGGAVSGGGFSGLTQIIDAINVANSVGVKLVPLGSENYASTLKNYPLGGYYIADEPSASDFSSLAARVNSVRSVDNAHFCYVNLFPDYASASQLGTSTYDEYVTRFINEVPVQILSFDYYPITSGVNSGWYNNLAFFSAKARAANKPFWAFALSTPHWSFPIPTIEHLRLQVFVNLAYGAQGIQYFTYWTPDCCDGTFTADNMGPISAQGNKTATYYLVKQVNAEIHGLAPVFLGAQVISLGHTGASIPQGTQRYSPSAPFSGLTTVGAGAVVSHLQNGAKDYLAIVNRDYTSSMQLSFTAGSGVKRIFKNGSSVALPASAQQFQVLPGDIEVFEWTINIIPDTTAPSAPASVRDGTSATADSGSTASTTQLSANWAAATDNESGISGYSYAIGTTAGGTQTLNWTALGNVTTVTRTGLTLAPGTTYYFSVKAVSAGGTGPAANSNGQYINNSPAAYWKLNEGSGTQAQDSSGNGVVGTISGASWTTGKSNGGLSFDGANDTMTWTYTAPVNNFSICAWIKATATHGIDTESVSGTGGISGQMYLFWPDNKGADAGAGISMGTNGISVYEHGNGYMPALAVYSGSLGTGWNHVAVVYENKQPKIYLNGALVRTGLASAKAAVYAPSVMGGGAYGYYPGLADEVRIYDKALTLQEIQGIYNADSADTTPPSAPGTVRDGTGTTDINSTASRAQLSANWTAAADAESGISGYSYAIGTTAGATNLTNWTSLGNVLTATKTGLSLSVGTTYYFSVKAVNGVGLTGSAANSNGQVVLSTAVADTTAPSAPGTIRDGAVAGTDAGFTYSTTTLSANWAAASDAQSGIASYQYAIGATAGGSNVANWATIGNVLAVTKTGLSLTAGTTYYFSVRAVNGSGLTGTAANSNGQYINAINTADTTAPSSIAQVRDGNETGTDADVTYLTDELSANWDAAADAESGINRYLYAIGTSPGATNITNWKDNGSLTEVTETGLTLTISATYYFSVKAENGVGMQSAVTNSNGQLVLSQDSQGPLISNVSAQGITNEGATITWETDEPSTSRVEYGLTASYGSLTGEYMGMNTAHSVSISGLQPQAQYHYRMISRDYAGNVSVSVDHTFTTLAAPVTPGESAEINAYPNPFDLSRPGGMKFRVSAASSETPQVRIYTMRGKLVIKLTAQPGATEISWDGTNEDGGKVTRGIYIYVLTNGSGSKITGKLAVVR